MFVSRALSMVFWLVLVAAASLGIYRVYDTHSYDTKNFGVSARHYSEQARREKVPLYFAPGAPVDRCALVRACSPAVHLATFERLKKWALRPDSYEGEMCAFKTGYDDARLPPGMTVQWQQKYGPGSCFIANRDEIVAEMERLNRQLQAYAVGAGVLGLLLVVWLYRRMLPVTLRVSEVVVDALSTPKTLFMLAAIAGAAVGFMRGQDMGGYWPFYGLFIGAAGGATLLALLVTVALPLAIVALSLGIMGALFYAVVWLVSGPGKF